MIDDLKKELLGQISELERDKEELSRNNTFKLSTNTAYLSNSGVVKAFKIFGHFEDWVRIKQEQGWKEGGSHQLQITFKIVPSKDAKGENDDGK